MSIRPRGHVRTEITGADQWAVMRSVPSDTPVAYLLSGTGSSVVAQMSFDGGTTWVQIIDDLGVLGLGGRLVYNDVAGVAYRVGVPPGGFSSGVTVELAI